MVAVKARLRNNKHMERLARKLSLTTTAVACSTSRQRDHILRVRSWQDTLLQSTQWYHSCQYWKRKFSDYIVRVSNRKANEQSSCVSFAIAAVRCRPSELPSFTMLDYPFILPALLFQEPRHEQHQRHHTSEYGKRKISAYVVSAIVTSS